MTRPYRLTLTRLGEATHARPVVRGLDLDRLGTDLAFRDLFAALVWDHAEPADVNDLLAYAVELRCPASNIVVRTFEWAEFTTARAAA